MSLLFIGLTIIFPPKTVNAVCNTEPFCIWNVYDTDCLEVSYCNREFGCSAQKCCYMEIGECVNYPGSTVVFQACGRGCWQ